MKRSEYGIFAYPWDFNEETVRERLERVRALGVQIVVLAALYHDGRQLLPRGPERVAWVKGGSSHVRVRAECYPHGLAPEVATTRPGAAEIAGLARALGIRVEMWTVSLHRDDLVRLGPCTLPRVENVFGEQNLAWLCPSAPATRDYLRAHATDLKNAGADAVVLEGCYFPGLVHGFHHESLFSPLGQQAAWLLSLCFCRFCDEAASDDLDVRGLRRRVRAEVERALAATDGFGSDADSRDDLPDDLREFSETRMDTITALVRSLRDEGVRVRYADQAVIAGSIFNTGRAGPQPAPLRGWRFGLDYGDLASVVDSVIALGYLADQGDLRSHVACYRDLGVPQGRLDVALRPMPPDSESVGELAEKIVLARSLGSGRVDFYNLGFMRDADLERLGSALALVA